MTSMTTKINGLVKSVFGEQDDFETKWAKDSTVQQKLKTIVNSFGGKPVKDPNAPKRGKSSYLFFCNDMRDVVKQSLGEEATATKITKELGERWNSLKASSKATDKASITKYQKMASEDRSRYENEKKDYVRPDVIECDNVKGRRRKKDPSAPKRAKSAYLFFCNQFRDAVKAENPSFKATDVTAELGVRWNALKSDSSRAGELSKYEKMAEDDKVRYQQECNGKVVDTEVVEVVEEVVSAPKSVKKGTEKKNNKKTVESKTKPMSGYNAFCQAHRASVKSEHPNDDAKNITKRLATMWKNLPSEEQEQWKSGMVSISV